jgi:hypothetical protein
MADHFTISELGFAANILSAVLDIDFQGALTVVSVISKYATERRNFVFMEAPLRTVLSELLEKRLMMIRDAPENVSDEVLVESDSL